MFENLGYLLGINPGILFTIFLIWYIMPLIVAMAYGQIKIGLILITILFGRTPLPWIVFFANMIESNESIKEIKDNQQKELNKMFKLYDYIKKKPDLFHEFLVKLEKNQE